MHFLNTILDLVFPVKCISCGENGSDLCEKCLRNIRGAERESAKWIFPVFDYRDPIIKKSLWLLKYRGKKRLARVFAKIIYEKMQEELSELLPMENFNDIILIPVPLSPKRRRERGFNQAELICRELIKINSTGAGLPQGGIPTPVLCRTPLILNLDCDILLKPKETEHQARIKDRKTRLRNLTDTFTLSDEKEKSVDKRNIILIDDITTTGATLNEARKILKKAGAKKVIAFTVAH